ncbi:AMP-binding protein [Granulosicoccus antarcticus]|uniref:AMP-binding protein n=1 Tax=Granulosicoccus antarcticus TaxID=437505 RepID=UPI0012FE1DEF|nr:AMP-binding protein [Granulosicoccus antarcticus]
MQLDDISGSSGRPGSASSNPDVTAGKLPSAQVDQRLAVRFISDESPELALYDILQASYADSPFCVIPASVDKAAFEVIVASDAAAGDAIGAGQAQRTAYDYPQFQCLSSGTSGGARRIQRSQRSWIKSFDINASLMQVGTQDSYAIVGTFSHSLPLYAALEACHLGADIQLLGDLRPDRQLQAIEALGTTVLYLTPTQARQLCGVKPNTRSHQFSVRYLLCGGGKLDEKTRSELKRLFAGAAIVEFYGASETSFITMSTEDTPSDSVGCAYPGVSIRVLDEQGQPVSGSGEIWVKSNYLFSGYASGEWRDTRRADGYLSIGEMGRLDEAGNLYLRGRKSRQANVADNTVFLQEIEAVMMQHAAVHQCVVVAKQDSLRGEILIAVVEGKIDEVLRVELLKHGRKSLGAILAPKQILFLEVLPGLNAGKPDIRKIQTWVDNL